MNYFDTKRHAYLTAPFENERAREEYNVPLEKWASYCNGMDRSSHYRTCERVLDISNLEKEALGVEAFNSFQGRSKKIILSKIPIERMKVDAVVNAANETLLGGGGVDEAIHKGAGPNLVRECATLNGCEVAQAKISKGYDLPAIYVIHTVAPILDNCGHPQPSLLIQCYMKSLECAEAMRLQSIAFPCLGCGFYGFPVDQSARIVLPAVRNYLSHSSGSVNTVIFSLFDATQQEAYTSNLVAHIKQ